MLRFTAALVLAWSLCAANVFAQAHVAPALWVVQGPKAKVYLFGTIHLMKPGVEWMTPAIQKALADSGELWLEVPDDLGNQAALMPLVQTLGLDPSHPLSTKISKADVDRLDVFAKANGLPGETQLEPFRPWLAAVMLVALPAMKKGYSADTGIDVTLRAKMTAAGKPVKGFETIDQQLHIFANLTQAQEVSFLHAMLARTAPETAGKEAEIDHLAALWESGDVDAVAKLDEDEAASDPGFMQTLVTNRNSAWTKQIDVLLRGEGTSFIAVGMAHLAGSGSVIDDLTKLGYTVTRVE